MKKSKTEVSIEVVVEDEQTDPRTYQVMKGGYWVVKLAKTGNDKMAKKVQEKIHNRDVSWENDLNKHLITNTHLWVKPDEVYVFDELGIVEFWHAVREKWIEVNNINTRPSQKTLEESE